MEHIRTYVRGLDLHRDGLTACARRLAAAGNPSPQTRKFKTTTARLGQLVARLAGHGVGTVPMEATEVNSKPVHCALDGVFDEQWLCKAHHAKDLPGYMIDIADAEWMVDVVACRVLRPSLVPPAPIRVLRDCHVLVRPSLTCAAPRPNARRMYSKTAGPSSAQ
jgi:transposase